MTTKKTTTKKKPVKEGFQIGDICLMRNGGIAKLLYVRQGTTSNLSARLPYVWIMLESEGMFYSNSEGQADPGRSHTYDIISPEKLRFLNVTKDKTTGELLLHMFDTEEEAKENEQEGHLKTKMVNLDSFLKNNLLN